VVLVNLVANKIREGRVLRTLLDKLETIRQELGSDKVFDVTGRQFQGASLAEIIMRAVVEDRDDQEASRVAGAIWLVAGPARIFKKEEIPLGVLSEAATLNPPPPEIPATVVLPQNLQAAWTQDVTTAAAIASTLALA
jgi:hypothetical protein